MKTKTLITGAILCVMAAAPAHAVTKCVALNSSTTCVQEDPGFNVADWTSTCTTNGVSSPIKGIGICSANAGSDTGASATGLEISTTTDENTNCWCKMTSPAVSRWVSSGFMNTAADCAQYCTYYCAYHVQRYANFRSAMFSSVSD